MTVEEMHYEFKLKLNKVDSLDYQNFFVPEIDWYLNEAMKMFIKQRYGLANPKRQGFEVTQKRIDDLRNLVVAGANQLAALSPVTDLKPFYTANLPTDYMFLVRVNADATKEGCESKIIGGIAPNILGVAGDLLPDAGVLGIVKNLVEYSDTFFWSHLSILGFHYQYI